VDEALDRTFHDSLLGGGECGRLIASRAWSATSLGPLDAWPQSLRTATSLLLRSPIPIVMLWGEDGVMLYNDAYSGFAGGRHPELLGSKVREGWPEVADFNDNVMRVGLAGRTLSYQDQKLTLYRHGRAEPVWMNLDYSPVLGEDGRPAGVLAIVVETTERVRVERRNAALVTLADALRALADPVEIQEAAARVLGEHLRAARVAYAEDAGDGDTFVLTRDYADGVPSIRGAYRYDDYGPDLVETLRAGAAVVRPDIQGDPSLTPAEKAAHAKLALGATLNVPLVKEGRLVAILAVHYAGPHDFHPDEIELAQEVAERTWAAVERARAETALRSSEARLSRAHAAARLGDFAWEVASGTLSLSGEYPRLLGLAPEALPRTAADFFAFIHPDERARMDEEVRPMLAGASDRLDGAYRILRGDGEVLWLGVSAQSEGRLPDGRPARVVGVNFDVTARRRAEAALRESEARFRLMADAVPQIVWITDAEGRTEFFNRQWAEYVGSPVVPSTAAGVAATAVHPDDAAMTMAAFDEARRTGRAFHVEHRVRSATGEYRWFLVRAEPYRDKATGEIVRWYGASVDIHDRKLAEARLREMNETLETRVAERTAELVRSEGRARAILDTSYQLMGLADVDGSLVAVNQTALDAFGVALDAVTGVKMWDAPWWARSAAEGGRLRREVARVARGESVRYEADLVMPDGRVRSFDFSMRPVLGAGGRPVQLVAEGRDVTEAKAAQAALLEAERARREADALYRGYFENSPEALFVIGVEDDGRFVVEQVNPAHEAALGFKFEQIRGKSVEQILPPDVAARILETYRRVIAKGEIDLYREVFDLGGTTQHWDTSLVPMRDGSGRITRLIGSSRNVTAQVVAEEALRQAQKMEAVGQLTGGLAHDFNNLLAAVVAAFELIRRRPDNAEKVRELAEAGLETAERGAKLTSQLLAFSRAQRIELKPVAVGDLIERMRGLLGSTLGPMIRLRLALERDGAVLSDLTQLEMAVLNLAINARDAMPDGGELTIGTRTHRASGRGELAAGEYVELFVADTGFGMSADVAARAFDPFFTTKGVGKGTGLGLSQVYGIARQAGGTVRIDSRPGAGATVRVYLPQTQDGTTTDAEPAAPDAPAAEVAGRILVVDDDSDVRRMLVAALESLGYEVRQAGDGPAGLAAIEEDAPDLMMVDFAMPGMNGAEVATAARARNPDLPIVFVSGYADTAAIEAVAGPEAPMLRKPFRLGDLHAVVSGALGDGPAPASRAAAGEGQ
jgi:PAS domain S-box-containing protein